MRKIHFGRMCVRMLSMFFIVVAITGWQASVGKPKHADVIKHNKYKRHEFKQKMRDLARKQMNCHLGTKEDCYESDIPPSEHSGLYNKKEIKNFLKERHLRKDRLARNSQFDENIKNLKRRRNSKKILVCHRSGKGHEHTISISRKALPAHLAHGDSVNPCG